MSLTLLLTLMLLLFVAIALSIAIAVALKRMLPRQKRSVSPRRPKPARTRFGNARASGLNAGAPDHHRYRDDSNLVGTLGAVGLTAAILTASESASEETDRTQQDCAPEAGDPGGYSDCSSDSGGSDGGGGGDGGD